MDLMVGVGSPLCCWGHRQKIDKSAESFSETSFGVLLVQGSSHGAHDEGRHGSNLRFHLLVAFINSEVLLVNSRPGSAGP